MTLLKLQNTIPMTESFQEKILKQANRLAKGLILVDVQILEDTKQLVADIHRNTNLALPNKKIKFLLSSPNKKIFLSRVAKLGNRFLKQ